LTIYHNPNDSSSVKSLALLEEARTAPFPKTHKGKKKELVPPPLSFAIEIHERSPTAEEFSDLIHMTDAPSFTFFLKQGMSQSFKCHPTNAQSLYDIVQIDPEVMHWPILVDYKSQHVALDRAGLKTMLKRIVHERDGKPKAPQPPVVVRRRPPPPSTAWIDYD